jgi:hypothetical protein
MCSSHITSIPEEDGEPTSTLTGEEVVKALNTHARYVETTLRGGNRTTQKVVLQLEWKLKKDRIVLAGYTIHKASGEVRVQGALFVTDVSRASNLPFMTVCDIGALVEMRLQGMDGLCSLHEWLDFGLSSDALMITRVSIPLTIV